MHFWRENDCVELQLVIECSRSFPLWINASIGFYVVLKMHFLVRHFAFFFSTAKSIPNTWNASKNWKKKVKRARDTATMAHTQSRTIFCWIRICNAHEKAAAHMGRASSSINTALIWLRISALVCMLGWRASLNEQNENICKNQHCANFVCESRTFHSDHCSLWRRAHNRITMNRFTNEISTKNVTQSWQWKWKRNWHEWWRGYRVFALNKLLCFSEFDLVNVTRVWCSERDCKNPYDLIWTKMRCDRRRTELHLCGSQLRHTWRLVHLLLHLSLTTQNDRDDSVTLEWCPQPRFADRTMTFAAKCAGAASACFFWFWPIYWPSNSQRLPINWY